MPSKSSRKQKAAHVLASLLYCLATAGATRAAEAAPASDQGQMLKEGVVLYDAGKFSEAQKKFEEILAANPANETARYELAMTLGAQKDWASCISAAEKGLETAAKLRAGFYAMAGNCADGSGDRARALAYYEQGLAAAPHDRQLLYNAALTLAVAGKAAEATAKAEAAVTVAPVHGSSNLLLAKLYYAAGRRVPAILAFLGALEVEPDSPRSRAAAAAVRDLVRGGVRKESDNKTTIFIPSPDASGTKSLSALELFLGAAVATTDLPEHAKESELERFLSVLTDFVAVCRELTVEQDETCFACRHYVPRLVALEKAEVLAPFLYEVFAPLDLAGTKDWAPKHEADLSRYAEWRRKSPEH